MDIVITTSKKLSSTQKQRLYKEICKLERETRAFFEGGWRTPMKKDPPQFDYRVSYGSKDLPQASIRFYSYRIGQWHNDPYLDFIKKVKTLLTEVTGASEPGYYEVDLNK